MAEEIDTFNKFGVGMRGDKIVILTPNTLDMSRDDAVLLAAWLVALADGDDQRFAPRLSRILNT